MAITSSSIEKVKVVPSFVWLSLLDMLLVSLTVAIDRVDRRSAWRHGDSAARQIECSDLVNVFTIARARSSP